MGNAAGNGRLRKLRLELPPAAQLAAATLPPLLPKPVDGHRRGRQPTSLPAPPELIIKPQISGEKVASQIVSFAKGIPFHPKDLTADNLSRRLRQTYLPLWLVDGAVQASWQAEVGFDYQVVSHREKFSQNSGGWNTEEVKETRIRWEPRLGRLSRTYHNQQAPALEEEAEMQQRLGGYEVETAVPYHPSHIAQTFIRLPNRPPQDAWPDAVPAFLKAAVAECQQASQADHIRDYRWTAEYHNLNWTQLLRPAYASYYLDDDGQPHPILINSQSGHISGSRRASMKRAQRWTLAILAVALCLFLIGVGLALASFFYEAALALGIISLIIALGTAFVALTPLFVAWNFNRKQRKNN
jgi:hypothetical protein